MIIKWSNYKECVTLGLIFLLGSVNGACDKYPSWSVYTVGGKTNTSSTRTAPTMWWALHSVVRKEPLLHPKHLNRNLNKEDLTKQILLIWAICTDQRRRKRTQAEAGDGVTDCIVQGLWGFYLKGNWKPMKNVR